MSLADKVVIVTGSSRGIGKSIAISFALHGAKIVLCSRHQSELTNVAKEIGYKILDINKIAFDAGLYEKKDQTFDVDTTAPNPASTYGITGWRGMRFTITLGVRNNLRDVALPNGVSVSVAGL